MAAYNRLYVGIDPGKDGGLACLCPGGSVLAVERMPPTERDLVDMLESWYFMTEDEAACCLTVYVEDVHSMPKQGVASSFKFGFGCGVIRGVLAALGARYEMVSPMRWQKPLGCLVKGRKATDDQTSKKNVNKAVAQRLFPQVPKITHATADALMIAEYGRRKELGTISQ